MKNYIALIGTLFLLQTWACHENNNFPETPSLTFLGMEKDTLIQGFSAEDSIIIYLELQDGDGDIGFESDDTISKSILIRDLRTGNISEQFNIPIIPQNLVSNGLQAEMQLKLYTTCCLFPDNIPPCTVTSLYPYDTISYEISIIDRAGNVSNAIITPPIILICD